MSQRLKQMSNTYCAYVVASGPTIDVLEAKVEELMDEGYVPSGSIQFFICDERIMHYFQPMILPST